MKKLKIEWSFGSVATCLMSLMFLSGLFMLFFYVPTEEGAFASIEKIMHEIKGGAFIRHIHMVGASFLFLAYYIHLFRGLYTKRYAGDGRLFWLLDIALFYLLMVVGFSGYSLPLSQMSGWGLTVISHMYSSVPYIGESISRAMLGGDDIGTATLHRMLIVHCTIPFVMLGAILMQRWAKRIVATDKKKSDKAAKRYGSIIFMSVFLICALFFPYIFTASEHLKTFTRFETPANIMPEWYFLPFYAQLAAFSLDLKIPFTDIVLITAQNQGLLAFFGSIGLWLIAPWLDRSEADNKYRRGFTVFLILDVIILGLCATKPSSDIAMFVVKVATTYYFLHFLIILPLLGKFKRWGSK